MTVWSDSNWLTCVFESGSGAGPDVPIMSEQPIVAEMTKNKQRRTNDIRKLILKNTTLRRKRIGMIVKGK